MFLIVILDFESGGSTCFHAVRISPAQEPKTILLDGERYPITLIKRTLAIWDCVATLQKYFAWCV